MPVWLARARCERLWSWPSDARSRQLVERVGTRRCLTRIQDEDNEAAESLVRRPGYAAEGARVRTQDVDLPGTGAGDGLHPERPSGTWELSRGVKATDPIGLMKAVRWTPVRSTAHRSCCQARRRNRSSVRQLARSWPGSRTKPRLAVGRGTTWGAGPCAVATQSPDRTGLDRRGGDARGGDAHAAPVPDDLDPGGDVHETKYPSPILISPDRRFAP